MQCAIFPFKLLSNSMFQTTYKEFVEEAFDKVEDTAKRMAAKKMLKLLGVKTFFPDPDEIPDITKAIEFFKSHLRNKKGKPIDAFDTMQKNDGRTGLSLFGFDTYDWNPPGLLRFPAGSLCPLDCLVRRL